MQLRKLHKVCFLINGERLIRICSQLFKLCWTRTDAEINKRKVSAALGSPLLTVITDIITDTTMLSTQKYEPKPLAHSYCMLINQSYLFAKTKMMSGC